MNSEAHTLGIVQTVLESKNEKDAVASVQDLVDARDQRWGQYLLAERAVVSAGNRSSGSSRYSKERFYRDLDGKTSRRDALKKELGV